MKKGFTIVELLIVIVVIAILAAITIVSYNGIVLKAAEASMRSDLRNTASLLSVYQFDNTIYPTGTILASNLKAESPNNTLSYAGTGTSYCLSISSTRSPLKLRTSSKNVIDEGACIVESPISGGGFHSLAVATNGQVYSWGTDSSGQLGNGAATGDILTPTSISSFGSLAGKTFTKVSGGFYHSLALASDGTVHGWGDNGYGQIGIGVAGSYETTPKSVSVGSLAGKTITQIAAGGFHSLALASDNTLHSWGQNVNGQLGTGVSDSSIHPTPVNISSSGSLAGKTIVQINSGVSYNLALASDGTVHAWGQNHLGQLGNGTSSSGATPTPVNISSSGSLAGKTITQVIGSGYHAFALASDGTLHAWGDNAFGKLGIGTADTVPHPTPVNISTSGSLAGKTITYVARSGSHSIAITSEGNLHTWGENAYGQLGIGTVDTSAHSIPVNISTSGPLVGKIITWVSGGGYHIFAVTADGELYSTGNNQLGQLGDGTVTTRSTATKIPFNLKI
jgi:prepilin-type N-terminal cleavage/methylation domain-containing protein